MLPKNLIPKKTRVNQNSCSSSTLKKKTLGVQTKDPEFFFITDGDNYIKANGEISREVQDNYQRAVDYVNTWNNLMDEYVKRKKRDEKTNVKVELYNSSECLQITKIPNFMAFFTAIFQVEDQNTSIELAERKSSFTQTSYHSDKDGSIGKHSSRSKNSIVLPEIEEDMSDAENVTRLTRNIQESQYRNYPPRNKNTSNRNINLSNNLDDKTCSNQKHARRSEGNILKTPTTVFGKENACMKSFSSKSITNSQNFISNHVPRKNHSFATLPASSSSVFQQKRLSTGILSANGMIASEINARGTPLVVRSMFEAIHNPLGGFVSKGNILKNISKNVSSSGSSVILSDEESKHLKVEDDCENKLNFGELSSYNFNTSGDGLFEEDITKSHPLALNERDLNTRDKNFISSIGIFTEAGELKQNAKTYLDKKEDVRKGIFRNPRVAQIHMAANYTKSCTSESLFSDVLSLQSSDIRSDD